MTSSSITLSDAKSTDPVGSVPSKSNIKSVQSLNRLLADEYTLFTKTLNFHWNVTGPRFHSLHKFLEDQYHELLQVMDDVAERVRILGSRPISTVKQMNLKSSLSEDSGKFLTADMMVNELLRDHLMIQQQIKDVLKDSKQLQDDPGTEDFLVGLLKKHEMTSWMLKSHLD